MLINRRAVLGSAALISLAGALPRSARGEEAASAAKADYTIRIAGGLVELAPDHIVSTTLYNGQFPGPLLRFKEGQGAVVEIYNDTDTPELVHWHGQAISSEADGAAEEGSPLVPAHGMRRISFVPKPSGFRFYHTHVTAGGDLNRGTYTGQVGPVYIEPRSNPGAYDREIFLVLKEFSPAFSRGGDMAMDALVGAPVKALQEMGKAADDAAKEKTKDKTKGFEVGYDLFAINGRMLGHGEPIRVRQGERVLFHVLNASATEIRSLALPGHTFRIVALDGNPVPTEAEVPLLWLGTAERVSAVVEMKHPGVWIMGDLADDDRNRGMGIVVEYAGHSGKPQWSKPKPYRWDYTPVRQTERRACRPRRDDRVCDRQAQCRARRLQPVDAQRRSFFDGHDEADVPDHSGPALPVEIPQRQRRHPSAAPAPPQLRIGAGRRQARGGRDQGCGDARRFSGGGIRLCRRQSGPYVISLSSAAAHGFRLYGALRLRMIGHSHGSRFRRDEGEQQIALTICNSMCT